MKVLEPALIDGQTPSAASAPFPLGAAPRPAGLLTHDMFLLAAIAFLPLVAPQPGRFSPTAQGWEDRVAVSDGLFVLAILAETWFLAWGVRQGRSPLCDCSPSRVLRMIPAPAIWYGVLGLLLIMALSWCANPHAPVSRHMLLALAIQAYLGAIGLLVAVAVRRWGSPKPLLAAWACGFMVLAIVCLYDSAAMLTGHTMIFPGGGAPRLRGPFRTSAQLAAYCISSGFAVLALSRIVSSPRWRVLLTALAAFSVPFVMLASRRSVLVALGAGLMTLWIVSKHRLRIFAGTTLAMLVISVAMILIVPDEIRSYMVRRIDPLIGQDPERVSFTIDHFGRGLAAFAQHPLMGIGFGSFIDTRFAWNEFDETHEQHSGYIAILAETGVAGFLLFIFLHLAVLVRLIAAWKHGPPLRREFVGFLLALSVALATSEIYNRVWRERAFWVVLGLVASLAVPSIAGRRVAARPPVAARDGPRSMIHILPAGTG